jgi:LPXTG-site transpeptidase (sortase) family protein
VKSGIIYKPGEVNTPVSIKFAVKVLKAASAVLSWVGGLMITVSIFGLVFVYLPLGWAEARYAFSRTHVAAVITNMQRDTVLDRNEEKKQLLGLQGKPLSELDNLDWAIPDNNYSIYIPKIMAISRVISNVDAGNSKEYLPALKQGVAEAANLAHPGTVGTTYLFAHSVGSRMDFARYNAVFYLLDKLGIGDEIQIVYQGKLYRYEMVQREILTATDTKYLVPQNLSEKLILQTCYPPGTSWKRLVVTARRI